MSDEKTEEPTEQRLRESAEKGQVAQRKNVSETFTVIIGILMIFATWRAFVGGVSAVFDATLDNLDKPFGDRWSELFDALVRSMMFGLVITAVLAFCGTLLHLLMNKFNFAPQSMSPKFEKFNPINGLKGIFSKSTIYSFFRLTIFFSAAMGILYVVVQQNLGEIIRASYCGIDCVAQVFYQVFVLTLVLILGVLLVLAVIDFKIQNMIFLSQSKMSKEEVKREHKGREGDPHINATRRHIAIEDAMAPTLREVTHVVYSGGFMVALVVYPNRLPYVAAKARGDSVRRMVARYRSAGVACANLPDVARDFFHKGAINQYMKRDCIDGLKKIFQSVS
jgi:type III secretion protein U